ncbi:MAG: DUF1475 family protein [Bacteroidetes bacterium]|nr:DUF1475 family protein [Bacteroidota bacterium]
MITSLKVLFGAVLLFISYQVIRTSLQSNLFEEWDYLAGIPWMRATLWDFYANVLVLGAWICYKESAWWKRVMWILALAALGSIGTCAYVLVQLFSLKKGETLSDLLVKRN